MQSLDQFHLPVRPYTPIDALNRRAAATGSPTYAQSVEDADYNGHHVSVHFNSFRGYWVADYRWGDRVVLSRGSFVNALRAAKREYDRGALGASVSVVIEKDHPEANSLAALAEVLGFLLGKLPRKLAFWTWRHDVAVQSARDSANPGALVRIFDWPRLQAAGSLKAYDAAIRAAYDGRIYQ
jgi:hypothetical protein